MIGEILQWIAIAWILFAIYNYGKAIDAINLSIKVICKLEQDRLDEKISKKPRKSFADRMKEESKKND